jgi:hypothetical protein
MVLAELEVFHSRPIAPTRRVALGDSTLPMDPHPGPGAVLLGAVMAAHVAAVPDELRDELDRLMLDVEAGRRIAQPRLRHRFQADRVGLQRSVHRLIGTGERLTLDLDDRAAPVQQALAAVYAVGHLGPSQRRPVMDVVRRGAHWRGDVDQLLLAHLSGRADARSWISVTGDPLVWALRVFGLEPLGGDDDELDRREVQRRFRQLLRDAHPDHGGASDQAARRIAELAEARRILLA